MITHEKSYREILTVTDRIVKEKERQQITSLSRTQCYQLEKQGKFPKRIHLGCRSVGWRLSELMSWIEDQVHSK